MFVLRSRRAVGLALGFVLGGCAAGTASTTSEDPIVAAPAATEPPRAGSGSTSGALAGESMTVADAVVFVGSISERDPSKRGARILLTSQPGTCEKPGVVEPGGGVLTLDVPIVDGAPVVGTYAVQRGSTGAANLVASLDVASETCFRKTVIVSGGSLTIEDATGGRVRGTFRLMLGRDTIAGTFDAAPCTGSEPPLALRCL